MWLIFLLSVAVLFSVGMIGALIASRVILKIKRDEHKFDLEVRNDFKNNNTKEF